MTAKSKAVVEAFMAALERLQRGEPTSKPLREKLAKGRLEVSFSSVALEAGHSRTLIGFDDCAYRDVRRAVAEASPRKRPSSSERSTPKVSEKTPKEADSRAKLAAADTLKATLFLEVERERNRADMAERRAARIVAGKEESQKHMGNIIPFPKR